jgi:mercuric ion transport protein
LIPLGLSGFAGTLAVTFAPYRIWFIVITVIMLSIAHLLVWKQKNSSKKTKKLLWVSTIVSVVMLIYTLFSQGI